MSGVPFEDIVEVLSAIAPPRLAASWDNVGTIITGTRPVSSLMLCVDFTAGGARRSGRDRRRRGGGVPSTAVPRCQASVAGHTAGSGDSRSGPRWRARLQPPYSARCGCWGPQRLVVGSLRRHRGRGAAGAGRDRSGGGGGPSSDVGATLGSVGPRGRDQTAPGGRLGAGGRAARAGRMGPA